jgi:succinyl-CoA synthetase beta subunit
VVVKAQVKTGGRGKAGGVKLASSVEEAREHAESILGLDIKGHVVNIVYVEPASDIAEEYYLSVMHDRVAKGYLVICSAEGGVEIEEVNRTNPDAVIKHSLLPSDVADGLSRDTARDIVARAKLPEAVLDDAADLLVRLFDAFRAEDATLAEINPLIRTTDDRVIALDAKVTLDDSAAFRHDDYEEFKLEGLEAIEPLEARAQREGIQYVKLDGEVGVLGNGAGLVMATLDVVAQNGGRAANFLDVGGGASADAMAASLDLVLSDEKVKSVFINIFGGITRARRSPTGSSRPPSASATSSRSSWSVSTAPTPRRAGACSRRRPTPTSSPPRPCRRPPPRPCASPPPDRTRDPPPARHARHRGPP